MGVQITDLLVREEIAIEDLKNKIIAVDSSLFLYQFLTSIRGRDGSLLTDSHGNITSHLVGLFSRTTKLMQQGLKLAYVFDGKAPKLKQHEQNKRKEQKKAAEEKYKIASEQGDFAEMKKYAARTTRLTPEMVDEAKKLIDALGLPIIEAPSEGEAQAAFLVKNKDAYGVASQDADSLLFGSPILIRNLSIAGKKKVNQKLSYSVVKPEIVDLEKTLLSLGINQEQLISLGMLIGTDFNAGGIKGIGPKNGLKLVKQFGADFNGLFNEVAWNNYFDYDWKEVFDIIQNMPITKNYRLAWKQVNEEELKKLLVEKHDFSEERINQGINGLQEKKGMQNQKGLGDFF